MAVLALSSIEKRFGANVALKDVSLQVQSGEFICLLGASGCGKTTLLRIIAGLENHNSGNIQLDDQDLSKVACHQRNIGMVFQSLALFPHLSVGENISYGQRMRGVSKEERSATAIKLLKMVGLSGYESRTVSSLSGGQRQRVAIARALALQPELFLMDEPFSALDAGLREHLQLEIKKLQQQLGVTTIFVTHDQREAMALADRIVILNEGRVEQVGTPAQIYQQPSTRFVSEFIGTNNLLDVNIDKGYVQFGDRPLGQTQGSLKNLHGNQTLAIRPEEISLERDTNNGNTLVGTVVMRRHIGAIIECEIDIGDQIFRQTALQNTASDIVVGDTVALRWDWQQAWVLPQ